MIHLLSHGGGVIWCDCEDELDDSEYTEDPRDSTCGPCLRHAAAYGAAAAMRGAAVEAGAHQDPELMRERDEAIRRLDAVMDALAGQGAFFCCDCLKLFRIEQRALYANTLSWCHSCAPHRPRERTR